MLISEYLIKSFFCEKFIIDIVDDVIENYDDEDEVGYITCPTYLTISGPKDIFLEILNTNFKDKSCLVKKI